MSLPLRKCGLKLKKHKGTDSDVYVTSLAEVWIETENHVQRTDQSIVTSLAEVWIETSR